MAITYIHRRFETKAEVLEAGFFKVAHSGGSYITADFYNPATKEYTSQCVRDYDYEAYVKDNDELYYMQIDEAAKRAYLHEEGIILVGDFAEVVKGRTIEHGFIGKVIAKKEYKDRYGRFLANYIYFEDGRKINVDNCKLCG